MRIELRMESQSGARYSRSCLLRNGSNEHPPQARAKDFAAAHQTGLQSDVQIAIDEFVRSQSDLGCGNGRNFGMSFQAIRFIARRRDDPASLGDNGPNRRGAFVRRIFGAAQCLFHGVLLKTNASIA